MKKCENPSCDNIVTEYTTRGKKLKRFCSGSCRSKTNEFTSREKRRVTMLLLHGVENPMQSPNIREKAKQTNLERHGVEHPMHSSTIKEKLKQTNINKYGVENVFQSEEIKNKSKQTNLERHGVENPMKSELIRRRTKQTNLERHGAENPMWAENIKEKLKQSNFYKYGSSTHANKHILQSTQKLISDSDWLKEQNKTKTLEQIADELSINSLILSRRFKQFNIPVKRHAASYFEKQIYEYAQSLRPNVLQNDRIQIKPFELDVYLPDLNIAFECNGEPWHKDTDKEISKYEKCDKLGIKLYFIWYSDWIERKDEVLRLISNILLQK